MLDVVTSSGSLKAGDTFVSRVLDRDKGEKWESIYWQAGLNLVVEVRSGNSPKPDSRWSAWKQVANGSDLPATGDHYLVYRVRLDPSIKRSQPVDFRILDHDEPEGRQGPVETAPDVRLAGDRPSRETGHNRSSWMPARPLPGGPSPGRARSRGYAVRVVEVRTGGTSRPDASWSGWTPVANGGGLPTPSGRYMIYRTCFLTGTAPEKPLPYVVSVTTQKRSRRQGLVRRGRQRHGPARRRPARS